MKVFHMLNSTLLSGAANYCLLFCQEQIKRGHDVLLYVEPGWAQKIADKRGIKNICEPSLSRIHQCDPIAIYRLKKAIAKHNPDVVYAHINKGSWLAAAISKCDFENVKTIRVRVDADPPKPYPTNRFIHKRWFDRIIAGSEMHKEACIKNLKYPEHRIDVIHGVTDTIKYAPDAKIRAELRQKYNIAEDEVVILQLGRLSPVKGHTYALEAFAALQNLPVKMRLAVFAYDAEIPRESLQDYAAELGISDKVKFFGYEENMPDFLKACDIGLIASVRSEATSRATLEYMATGLPTVATRVGVIPELMTGDFAEFCVEPKNSAALASALSKLLTDKNLRLDLGKQARDKIQNEYSLEILAHAIEASLQKVFRS
ncbi:MAG: glycosyltransferase family 4 protein [Candidatus Riflebacteria bacterium]|nr:glycosyltransferase family 4 protein [Candidatus Riflebacteria bacterium]